MGFGKKWVNPSATKLYYVWRNMRRRCGVSTDTSYAHYGGRGITVCKEWQDSYDVFHDWAISAGFVEGLSLDRIDVNGNYTAENCRWVTTKEQHNNERRNIVIEYAGEKKTIAQWAESLGVHYDTMWKRFQKYKMSPEKALVSGRARHCWLCKACGGYT